MNRIFLTIILSIFFNNSFSQQFKKREVHVKPYYDTTFVEFHDIFNLWENYLNDLNIENKKVNFLLNSFDEKLNSYWLQSEVDNYNLCDLYFSFLYNYGQILYPIEKECFLGIEKRDTNIYELKTMFISPNKENSFNFPDFIITVPVIRTGDSYKLCNKFTLNKSKLLTKKYNNITYYYAPFYKFNDSLAKILQNRINVFVKNFNISYQPPISYLVANNLTEISNWFGIDFYFSDFSGGKSIIEGRANSNNKMIFSGGGGENYMHEIIHILIDDINPSKNKDDTYFEEGIACYFGESLGHDYLYHAKKVKEYLNTNTWINLSENLLGYYLNSDHKISLKLDSTTNQNDYKDYGYRDMIEAVLCDIAFKQGGYQKVKDIYIQQRLQVPDPTYQKFYTIIEKELGVKRENVDKYIRDFLNKNY